MPEEFDPNKKVTIQDLENQVKNYRMFLEIQGADKPEVIKDKLIQLRRVLGLPTETKEEARNRVTSQEIKEWIDGLEAQQFHVRDVYAYIPHLSKTSADKKRISNYLNRAVKQGLIERDGRYGQYRKVQTDIERMDLINADEQAVDIWLPFNLKEYVEIPAGAIILIAGEQDSGKTTIALNIAWANRNKWDVHYFNSELGRGALKKRAMMFKNTDIYEWTEKISFYPLSHNFEDFVKTGSDKLNIIDFMEVSGDDYPFVATWIRKIHDKIVDNGAIAIICLQKPPGRDEATGGRGTLDKPRLYLAVERGKIKIVRAKDWASEINPRELAIDFKIVKGSDLIPTSEWSKTDRWRL